MKIKNVKLTKPLEAWLASRGDGAPLLVREEGEEVVLTREGGEELLPHEVKRVLGILAAHAASPFKAPPKKN